MTLPWEGVNPSAGASLTPGTGGGICGHLGPRSWAGALVLWQVEAKDAAHRPAQQDAPRSQLTQNLTCAEPETLAEKNKIFIPAEKACFQKGFLRAPAEYTVSGLFFAAEVRICPDA